jgi:hypothetical protein
MWLDLGHLTNIPTLDDVPNAPSKTDDVAEVMATFQAVCDR